MLYCVILKNDEKNPKWFSLKNSWSYSLHHILFVGFSSGHELKRSRKSFTKKRERKVGSVWCTRHEKEKDRNIAKEKDVFRKLKQQTI